MVSIVIHLLHKLKNGNTVDKNAVCSRKVNKKLQKEEKLKLAQELKLQAQKEEEERIYNSPEEVAKREEALQLELMQQLEDADQELIEVTVKEIEEAIKDEQDEWEEHRRIARETEEKEKAHLLEIAEEAARKEAEKIAQEELEAKKILEEEQKNLMVKSKPKKKKNSLSNKTQDEGYDDDFLADQLGGAEDNLKIPKKVIDEYKKSQPSSNEEAKKPKKKVGVKKNTEKKTEEVIEPIIEVEEDKSQDLSVTNEQNISNNNQISFEEPKPIKLNHANRIDLLAKKELERQHILQKKKQEEATKVVLESVTSKTDDLSFNTVSDENKLSDEFYFEQQ